LGAAVAGFGLLLAAVAAMAWRRANDRKMAVLAAAFAVSAVGGALLLADELTGGPLAGQRELLLSASMLGTLLLLYGALFLRRR